MSYQLNPFTGDFDQTSSGAGFDSSAALTLTANGAASTPPLKLNGTWFTGGTGTTTKPQLLIEPTGTTSTSWNTAGTGLGINAPSGFTGNLLDFKYNNSSLFQFRCWNGAYEGWTVLRIGGAYPEIYATDGYGLFLKTGSGVSTGIYVTGEGGISLGGFGNVGNYEGAFIISEDSGVCAHRYNTTKQSIRIYDTFVNSTDYHRLALATARATLSNVSGASVTASALVPDGAVVVGVTSKVTTALGTSNGTTGYQIGDGSDVDRWGAITGTALGTSSDNRDWTATTVQAFTSATDVVITATGGNFDGTGVIYLSVQYLIGQAD